MKADALPLRLLSLMDRDTSLFFFVSLTGCVISQAEQSISTKHSYYVQPCHKVTCREKDIYDKLWWISAVWLAILVLALLVNYFYRSLRPMMTQLKTWQQNTMSVPIIPSVHFQATSQSVQVEGYEEVQHVPLVTAVHDDTTNFTLPQVNGHTLFRI